jgi:hypothetical protein
MSEIPKAEDNQAKAKKKARDLKAKGYTLDDIRKAGALETELVSDKPTTEAGYSTLSRFNPEAVKSLETAFEALEMEEGESGAIAGEQLRVDPQQEGEIEGGKVWEQREADVVVERKTTDSQDTDLVASDEFKGTDLISEPIPVVHTIPELKEQVFIASAFTDEPVTPSQLEMEVEAAITEGFSPLVSSIQRAASDLSSQTQQQALLTNLTGDIEQDAKAVKSFSERVQDKPEALQNQLREDYYSTLNKTGLVPDDAFDFITRQVGNLNAMSRAASIIARPLEDKIQLGKDLGSLLVPIYGEAIFLEFQTAMAEDNGDKAWNLVAGNHNLDKVVNEYWDLPPEEQYEFITGVVEVAANMTVANDSDNQLLKLDFVSKLYDKIVEGEASKGDVTKTDAIAIAETALSEMAIVFPMVKVLKDMLRAKRLSRILGIAHETPVDRLGKDRAFWKEDDVFYENKGTGTSLDITVNKDPDGFRRLTNDRELKDITDSMGVDPSDMPQKILPRVNKDPNNLNQPAGVHHQYLSTALQRKIDNNHLAQQLTDAEVDGLLPTFVRDLATELGETATPHLDKSYFDVDTDASGTSLGVFVVRLGDGIEGGFKTSLEASQAASRLYGDNAVVVRKTPYGNFSEDLMEGTNAYGEYYIEMKQRQETTAKSGQGTFLGGEQLVTGGSFKPVLNAIFDDDLLFNDKIQKTYSNIRDRANAFGVELGTKSEDLIALSTRPQDIRDFNILATKMQDMGIDEVNVTQLKALLGKTPSDKVVKALKSARDINLANWAIKNNSEYAALASDRYKTVLAGENRFISRPYIDKPNANVVKGNRIYDPESNTDLPLNQKVIDDLYEGGGVLAKLYKNAKTKDGEFTHIMVRGAGEQVKALQPDVTPYVKGHYERVYEDDGFIVTGLTRKKIDGQMVTETIALGIEATKSSANRLAVGLANRGYKLHKTPVVPTGEYVSRMGLKSTSAFSLQESIARGERLKGFHGEEFGMAEVLDPFDAYVKTLHKTRLHYEKDVQGIMKQRFIDRYSPIMKVKTFPSEIKNSNLSELFKDPTGDAVAIQEATSFHRRVKLAEGGDMERATDWINSLVRKRERIADAKGQERLAKAIGSVNLSKIQGLGVGYASTRFIWGNPVYQALSVVAQTPILLSQGIGVVTKSLGELAFEFVPLMLTHNTAEKGVWVSLFSKSRGVSEERVLKEMDAIIDSGIIRTANIAHDYQSEMNLLFKTLLESPKLRGVTVGVNKGLSLPIKGLKTMVVGSIDAYELLSFFVAKNTWLKKNKGGDWTKASAMEEISYNARGLSLNQNDTGRLVYQNNDNLARLAMSMTSYTARMFTRQYLDPLTLGLMSKAVRPKGSRMVNPYAKTPAVALASAAIGFAIYGESFVDPLDLDFEESQREYLRAIASGDFTYKLDKDAKTFFENNGIKNPSNFLLETYYRGLMTSSTNAMFDGDSDWVEKFTPNSFLKTMYSKITNIGNTDVMDSLFGLPWAASVGLFNTTVHNAKMLWHMENLNTNDAIFAALEVASQLKIVDDGVAAYMAINIGRRVSKSTLSAREQTTTYEQLSKIAGGIPLSEFYGLMNFDKSSLPRTSSDTYQNFMTRKAQFEVYNAYFKKGDDLTEDEATDILKRNLTAMFMGDESLVTDDALQKFKSKILVVGDPVKYGEMTISREIQEQGVKFLLNSLKDKTPEKTAEGVRERLGVIKLAIEANPRAVELHSEKEVLEVMLRNFYGKSGKELNEEYIEEVAN